MSIAPEMDEYDRTTIDSLRSQGVGSQLMNRVEIMRESAYVAGRADGLKAGQADVMNKFEHLLSVLDRAAYSPYDIHELLLDAIEDPE